jgi:CRP-like cAMP-binding protein
MKDQLTAVLEAVRLVQADLADYVRSGETNPRETLDRIMTRLASQDFIDATRLFGVESPSIVPPVKTHQKISG